MCARKGEGDVMGKDWVGNKNSVFKALSASNHTREVRESDDYYATDPIAAELLCEVEQFQNNIWECSVGEGHLAKVFTSKGYNVYATDLIDRGYGIGGVDFLDCNEPFDGDIITNPPYKYATAFVEKSMELLKDGAKLALFVKIQFLETKGRKSLFEKYPPKVIYVSSSRILCAKNGDFQKAKDNGGSAVAYIWCVWEKGYKGDTVVKWIN